MISPLLETKLHSPPLRPDVVPRPHLIERLDAGLQAGRRLTLVSAPAGFGKTTLLCQWTDAAGWLSLDEDDDHPARFWTYLIAALRTVHDPAGDPGQGLGQSVLHLIQSLQPAPAKVVLTPLLNDVAALPRRIVLVIDDYHVISDPSIHAGVTFLLEHQPSTLHLAIATRVDPPLPLARLRGRGQLTELRQADLSFTPEEAGGFLRRFTGCDLSSKSVTALTFHTEGWIAGLQLAALAVQATDDPTAFIQALTGSHRYVIDYLTEEVLQRQSRDIQSFLLRTSILDRLTGPLCDAVLGISEGARERIGESARGQETLEYLERHNLFVVPLDGERRWYRYHHLFRDVLRQRLQQIHPELTSTLHRRASRWYEQNDLVEPAVDHAMSAGDIERATQLIDGMANGLWKRGEQASLSRLLDALPDEELCAHPQLCIYHAMVLFSVGRTGAAEARLDEALRVLGAQASPDRPALRGALAAARAFITFSKGDVPTIIRLSRQALKELPEENLTWRSVATYTLGLSLRLSGDLETAHRVLTETVALGTAAGNSYVALLAQLNLARLQTQRGHLRRAAELLRQALHRAAELGMAQLPIAGLLSIELGSILVEWNQLEEAIHVLEEGARLIEQGEDVTALQMSHAFTAQALYARGDVDGANAVIQKMEQLSIHSDVSPWLVYWTAALKMRLYIAGEDLSAAAQVAEEIGLSIDEEPTYVRWMAYGPLVQLYVARGESEATMGLLERLLQAAETSDHRGQIIATLVRFSLALQVQGETDQALASLERALSLAEPEGYVRVFIEQGPAMAALLRHAASQGIAPAYASRLLSAFPASEPDAGRREQPLVEPLSPRELEVLHLLTSDLTLKEIAKQLFIAHSTIRSHTKSIYGKLAVHNRRAAVRRAHTLGLLD